jgi:hypothetical protein
MIQAYRPAALTAVSENMTAALASSVSAGVAKACEILRVVNGAADIRIVVGATPVALPTSPKMVAATVEYFLVHAGDKVAVLRDAATDSAVNISFLSR